MNYSEDLVKSSELFREAAFDSEKLGTALSFAANLFGGEAAQIITLNNRGVLLSSFSAGIDINEASKQEEYLNIHPRIKVLKTLQEGDVTYDYAAIAHDDIAKDQTYQELLKPNNLDWYAGSTLIKNDQINMGFALFREESLGHFSKDELKQFKWLSDQVSEAAKLGIKLDALKLNAHFDALEACFKPIAALSIDGHIIEMSDAFHSFLKEHHLAKLSADGRIILNDPLVEAQLKSAIPVYSDRGSSNFQNQKTREVFLKSPQGLWVALKLHPIPTQSRWANIGAVALLTIREASTHQFDVEQLRGLFDLTRAEAELTSLLAMGKSIREASVMRGIAYETTRFHTKSIYSKIGCKSQVELVFLLNRLFQ